MTARRLGYRTRLAFAAALTPIFLVLPANASDLVLIWDAPQTCPNADQVRKQMLKRLGSQARTPVLKAHAAVTRDREVFRVRLHTFHAGQRGLRTLEAKTCSELVDAIAVIVALAADSESSRAEAVVRRAASERGGTAQSPRASVSLAVLAGGSAELEALDSPAAKTAETAAGAVELAPPAATEAYVEASPAAPARAQPEALQAVAESSSAAPAPTPEDENDADAGGRAFTALGLQAVASLAGAVESGILPGLGFGLTVRGGARLRRFRVEGALSRWFAREASAQPGRGADIHGMAIAAWTCFRAVPAHTAPVPRLRSALPPDDAPAIEAGPCLGMELGRLQAQSFGVSEARSGSGAYAAAGGGMRLGATASEWLSLDVRFEAFRVLHRPEFRVQNLGTVHQPAPWSLRASLGAEAYFP
jgi:hypothetical protein